MTRQDAKAESNAEEAETGCSDGERQKGGCLLYTSDAADE